MSPEQLHAAIMNIQVQSPLPAFPFSAGPIGPDQLRAYKEGFKDARHAAAELALAAAPVAPKAPDPERASAAAKPPETTPYSSLQYIRTEEDLKNYVDAHVELALAEAKPALTDEQIEAIATDLATSIADFDPKNRTFTFNETGKWSVAEFASAILAAAGSAK